MSYICVSCGEKVKEVCGDGYCRKCHVSLSFEDCVSGKWVEERVAAIGTPEWRRKT